MNKLLLAAVLAFSSAPVLAAQPAADATPAPAKVLDGDPALWVVKDEDTTVYLFGTFHLLDGRRDWFNDEIEIAFDASDKLMLEGVMPEDPSELRPLMLTYAIDPEHRTLSSRLDDQQQRRLSEALTSMGMPDTAFERFEPWFASLMLTGLASQRLGLSPEDGAEAVLTQAARASGLEIGELEGWEYQLRLFDGLPEQMQLGWLDITIDRFDEIGEELAPPLAAWSNGEIDRLAALLNDKIAEYPEFYRIVLSQRNANWAEWIDERLDRPGTVFLAVGAGHLGGRDSVQSLLAQRGLQTTRLE